MRKLYQVLSARLQARINCNKMGNSEWFDRHTAHIEMLTREHLPSGSGFDAGTSFDFDASTPDKLAFNTSFHHMDEHGGYSGWSEHRVIVSPSLAFDFNLRITGKDKNTIKDYISELFNIALMSEVDQ